MTETVKAALKKLSKKVMGRPGVTGTALGGGAGSPCLMVYVRDSKSAVGVPSAVDGVPVKVEVTGTFRKQ